jgi:hypothetical protein
MKTQRGKKGVQQILTDKQRVITRKGLKEKTVTTRGVAPHSNTINHEVVKQPPKGNCKTNSTTAQAVYSKEASNKRGNNQDKESWLKANRC